MTEPQSDDEFETFLKRRTVLPNGMSDDDKLEPPRALDALVLKRAREAVRERRPSNRAPRWAMPVALAATILLCLSVVLNVSLNTNRPTADLRRQAADTAVRAPAAAPGAATESELREEVVTGTASREAILPEVKIAEPRAPRPPVLAETKAPPQGPPGQAAPAPGSATDHADHLARRADAPAKAPTEASQVLNSVVASRFADRNATPPATPSDAPPPTSAARSAAAPHPGDPKTWLRKIDALRAEGKTAQADAEMQRFRAIFPAYPAKAGLSAPSEAPK